MSTLSLYLLGPPKIEVDGSPINFDTRKAVALIAYIATIGNSHPRDSLVNLLWPDYDRSRGRANLRRTLYTLKKNLPEDHLYTDRETVSLSKDADIQIDILAFKNHIATCLTHGHPQDQTCPACLQPLLAAVKLYRGDYLSGFTLTDSINFDEWQFTETEHLRLEYIRVLEKLVKLYQDRGQFDSGIHYARRLLALDSLNEKIHQRLMCLYHWSGKRSAVHQQYLDCQKMMQEELGIPPEPSTTNLYQAIMDDQVPPPQPTALRYPNSQITIQTKTKKQSNRPGPENKRFEGHENIFVARQEEIKQLMSDLEGAINNQGKPVFLTGGPGQGKTALFQEFSSLAQARYPNLLSTTGNCNAHTGFGDPYLPFREMLRMLTGDIDALWTAGSISPEHARRLWDAFPLVVELLAVESPDLLETFISSQQLARRVAAFTAGGNREQYAWAVQFDQVLSQKTGRQPEPNIQQKSLFEQFTRFLIALSHHYPLLLFLDDLQWADSGSVSLLFHLGRRITGHRILLIGAYRPEEISTRWGEDRHPLQRVFNEFQRTYGAITIDLSQAKNRVFIDAYLDTEPNHLGADFRDTLYQKTDGQPLFTIEFLRGMQDRGDIFRDEAGFWITGEALNWDILPSRIEAVIAERVGRLNPEVQELLRVASVEGEVFTAEVIAQVLGIGLKETVDILSTQLEREHRLVVAQEIQRLRTQRISRYRLRHILFQNYLYQTLDPIQRVLLHEAVADVLEQIHQSDIQEAALSLARHYQQAGIPEKAITYLVQGAEKAIRGSANEAAIDHLTSALHLLEQLPPSMDRDTQELQLLITLGLPTVLIKGHASSEIKNLYTRAIQLCQNVENDQNHFQALLGLRRYYLHQGSLTEGQQLGKQLIALAQHMKDPDNLSRAFMMDAETLFRLGEFTRCQESAKKGLNLYNPIEPLSHAIQFGNDSGIGCRIFITLTNWILGLPEEAMEAAEELLDRAHTLNHPFTLVFCLYFMARLYQLNRDPEVTYPLTQELLKIADDRGFLLYQIWGSILNGWSKSMLGDPEEGIQQMENSLEAWRNMGARLLIPSFNILLAEAYIKTNQVNLGLKRVEEGLSVLDETGERTFDAELIRLKGQLLRQSGTESKEVEATLMHAQQVANRQGAKIWELRAVMDLCTLWKEQGKIEQASKTLRKITEDFEETAKTPDLVDARKMLAGLG